MTAERRPKYTWVSGTKINPQLLDAGTNGASVPKVPGANPVQADSNDRLSTLVL